MREIRDPQHGAVSAAAASPACAASSLLDMIYWIGEADFLGEIIFSPGQQPCLHPSPLEAVEIDLLQLNPFHHVKGELLPPGIIVKVSTTSLPGLRGHCCRCGRFENGQPQYSQHE